MNRADGEKLLEEAISGLYESIDFEDTEKLGYELFQRAITGFYQLRNDKKLSEKQILTIIDFRRSGNDKRLWVIDLKAGKVLFHSLVAHGRNSGQLYAEKFSNTINSNQSSLGFYVTGRTYIGKHGISLRLHGVEKGFNDHAAARAVVIHGADYVSDAFIKRAGRLGRSFGCPAVPMDIHKELVRTLAGGTCLFIFYPDKEYLEKTELNDPEEALEFLASRETLLPEPGSKNDLF